jgi:enamine deaminase RidA (YjgF/YER057c/UK114 family)
VTHRGRPRACTADRIERTVGGSAGAQRLDRVTAVVKLLGVVNATPDFTDHPKVMDGCSELLIEIPGEAGAHARSAIGGASLPNNITVEIEAIFAVEPKRKTASQ